MSPFYLQHPNETLIIVTADHETGGLALGGDETSGMNLLVYDERQQSITYSVSLEEKNAVRKLDKKAGVAWTTNGHTGVMTPLFAIGAGSHRFGGKIDNTDIPKRILEVVKK